MFSDCGSEIKFCLMSNELLGAASNTMGRESVALFFFISPNEQKITFGCDAIVNNSINQFQRRNANGTAQTVNQFVFVRQRLVNVVPDNRMRLTAANFHNRTVFWGDGANRLQKILRQFRVTKFL